jgi:hypothetical protein
LAVVPPAPGAKTRTNRAFAGGDRKIGHVTAGGTAVGTLGGTLVSFTAGGGTLGSSLGSSLGGTRGGALVSFTVGGGMRGSSLSSSLGGTLGGALGGMLRWTWMRVLHSVRSTPVMREGARKMHARVFTVHT